MFFLGQKLKSFTAEGENAIWMLFITVIKVNLLLVKWARLTAVELGILPIYRRVKAEVGVMDPLVRCQFPSALACKINLGLRKPKEFIAHVQLQLLTDLALVLGFNRAGTGLGGWRPVLYSCYCH